MLSKLYLVKNFLPEALYWTAELVASISLNQVLGLIAFMVLLSLRSATNVQGAAVAEVKARPDETPNWMRLEVEGALIRPLWKLVQLVRRFIDWIRKKKRPEVKETYVFVLGHGPVYLQAGMVCAGLYLLFRLMDPLVALSLGLPYTHSAFSYLTLGQLPGMQEITPLHRFPEAALLLSFFTWFLIWGAVTRGIRVLNAQHIFRNQADSGKAPTIGPAWWMINAGHRRLLKADDSYKAWAVFWAAGVALLLALTVLWSQQDPYRVWPGAASVSI
jgi:hypothetical protein